MTVNEIPRRRIRVYMAIPRSTTGTDVDDFWVRQLYHSVAEMVDEAVLFEEDVGELFADVRPLPESILVRRERLSEQLVRSFDAARRSGPIDLVFLYVCDSAISPGAIDHLKSAGAPVVNFFCNNYHQFEAVKEPARRFDLNLVPEHSCLQKYEAAGARALYWPMACNPEVFQGNEAPETMGATFAGQRYADRARLAQALVKAGVPLQLFGKSWARPKPPGKPAGWWPKVKARLRPAVRALRNMRKRKPVEPVPDLLWETPDDRAIDLGPVAGDMIDSDRYVRLFRESRVSLGFTSVPERGRPGEWGRHIRLRDFEAPMAGACYLTQRVKDHEWLYDMGAEIETFDTPEELIEKCRALMADKKRRDALRRAGRKRALAEHTWQHRFEKLFDFLGLK